MSDEATAALRRAWHSEDAAAMVAAVEQVGLDVCLQWTGDLVHAALRSRSSDADALADE